MGPVVRQRIRVRFAKQGDLRFLSHHDLMRCWVRALRRSGLPLRMTEGFNPRPRVSFPLPLGVGVAGTDETMSFQLRAWLAPHQVWNRLAPHLPADLPLRAVQAGAVGKTDQVEWVRYRVTVPEADAAELDRKVAGLLAAEHWPIQRTRKGRSKVVDIRPYVLALNVQGSDLVMQLKVTPTGTARPDEILEALSIGSILTCGATMTRTQVALKELK